jgi:hypothetical protein
MESRAFVSVDGHESLLQIFYRSKAILLILPQFSPPAHNQTSPSPCRSETIAKDLFNQGIIGDKAEGGSNSVLRQLLDYSFKER